MEVASTPQIIDLHRRAHSQQQWDVRDRLNDCPVRIVRKDFMHDSDTYASTRTPGEEIIYGTVEQVVRCTDRRITRFIENIP